MANPLDAQIENELNVIIEQLDRGAARSVVADSTTALSARLESVRASGSAVPDGLRLGRLLELVYRAQSVMDSGGEPSLARMLLEQARLNWLAIRM